MRREIHAQVENSSLSFSTVQFRLSPSLHQACSLYAAADTKNELANLYRIKVNNN